GLGFAAVPLYRMFCEATGLNGTTQRGLRAPGATGQKITIAFDSNVSPKLPWKFVPERREDTIDIGGRDMAFFTATNLSNQ
ncbi:cytochrome c oxidase assembly protein, partial [Escherichia coli]|uniref:cytochrome c oxidase assembly protein n=2 Tax=Pseudomonadota TaxID=1224 RepID=UPI003CF61852